MKLPVVLSEGFIQALPDSERKRLGSAAFTAEQRLTNFQAGQETAFQNLCAQWLDLEQIYYETDRMDKRTSGKKGRADFRICYRGFWLSAECKAAGKPLEREQAIQAARLRASGGRFALCYTLNDLIEAVRHIDRIASGLVRNES